MRKVLLACLISATLAGPSIAHAAGIGPKSLKMCDIYAWIGIVNVMSCEGT